MANLAASVAGTAQACFVLAAVDLGLVGNSVQAMAFHNAVGGTRDLDRSVARNYGSC